MPIDDEPEDGNELRDRRDSSYPAGPMPPHERVWRHPSELGFAAAVAADSAPVNIGRTGRSLLGFSTVTAALLLGALFVALQPTAPEPDAEDVIALTNSELRIASLDHPGPLTVDVSANAPDPASFRPDEAVGIMLPDGNFLVTTMSAIADVESIDVRLAGGRTVRARVVQTYPDLSVAVLSISEQSTSGVVPEIDVMSIVPRGVEFDRGQLVVALVDIPRQLMVSDPIDDILIALRSPKMSDSDLARVSEGAPIVDKSGRLVGLCTYSKGTLGFIPFVQIEEVLSNWISDGGGRTTSR
ncbi:MAG: hypothetical protein ACO3SP_06905 [Ilumatobacteraceae bacterium]